MPGLRSSHAVYHMRGHLGEGRQAQQAWVLKLCTHAQSIADGPADGRGSSRASPCMHHAVSALLPVGGNHFDGGSANAVGHGRGPRLYVGGVPDDVQVGWSRTPDRGC